MDEVIQVVAPFPWEVPAGIHIPDVRNTLFFQVSVHVFQVGALLPQES
jgi:hypothetical protein